MTHSYGLSPLMPNNLQQVYARGSSALCSFWYKQIYHLLLFKNNKLYHLSVFEQAVFNVMSQNLQSREN